MTGKAKAIERPHERAGLIRIVGYFFPEEVAALDAAAEEKGCSRAEILRRALRAYLDVKL
ncbi:MAG TPA: CopG family transcriptional regulator [Thermoanaerobaculia bacterium]|nr:CopG family transcriptional regulator [Thermoanaerobaculia bacterium]